MKDALITIAIISLSLSCFQIGTLVTRNRYQSYIYEFERLYKESKPHDHWAGKMDYYLSSQEVFIENDIEIPDSVIVKIEQRYMKRSTISGYKPYSK